jgi:transcription initiation factor TFIIIB Brf1 subunit/transcription initiation factor TFIIB
MFSFDFGKACPECSGSLIDAGNELVCPGCGIVSEKEVIEVYRSKGPALVELTTHALGSYLGSAGLTMGERNSRGFSKSHSTYGYLKTLSDFAGREDGSTYECAKIVERVCEKLSLPKMVAAEATVLAKRLVGCTKGTDRRITLAAVSACAILASCKAAGVASVSTPQVLEAHRSMGRRVKVSSVIQVALRSDLKARPTRPEECLSRLLVNLSKNTRLGGLLEAENVGMTLYLRELRSLAEEVLGLVDDSEKAGHRPSALAATAIYAAEVILAGREHRERRIAQKDVAECGEIAEYTVREQYRQIFTPSLTNSKFVPALNTLVRPAR